MAFPLPHFFDYAPYFTCALTTAYWSGRFQETRKKQSALWQELLLSYCRHHKVYKVSLSADELPIFHNQKIDRRLNLEAKRVFFADLVSSGHGLWLDKQQDLCLILWKSLDAWAQTLRQWARSVGMQDSVTTLDDLSTGAEVVGTELHGAPRELLISAVRLLEKRGEAKLFKGTSADDDGVKFFF